MADRPASAAPEVGYGPILDALRGVSWPARLTSRGATSGTHVSRLRGASAEFTEYRAYRQGDDPRRLDWRLLARTDRAFVRITNERSVHPTRLVLDASASMAFPSRDEGKWAAARRLAVGLAAVAHAAGDPVGIVVSGTSRALPLRARRGVVAELATLVDAVAPAGDAPLAPLLRSAARAPRIAIVTDLLGDADATIREAGQAVAAGTDVLLVHVVARQELELPANARLVTDPEDEALRRPLGAGARAAYRVAFDAWRQEMARRWRGIGARYVEVIDDEPAEHAIRRIVAPSAGASDGRR